MAIYTKIKLWAEKKERGVWLKKYRCDQKCPKCNTWQGNCGGWQEMHSNTPTDMNDKLKCGKCGQWTTFLDIGVGYIQADDVTGMPLKLPQGGFK